ELSSMVSTRESYELGDPDSEVRIAVLDLGIKRNILRNFEKRGAFMKVFPMKTSLTEMLEWGPSGIFISNGPGDPAAMEETIEQIRKIIDSGLPVFGICLGHQLIALAQGLRTYKMH